MWPSESISKRGRDVPNRRLISAQPQCSVKKNTNPHLSMTTDRNGSPRYKMHQSIKRPTRDTRMSFSARENRMSRRKWTPP